MSKSNIAGYDIEKNPVAPNLLLEWEGGDVTVYVPHIQAVPGGYQLSWTNDAGLENPQTITITNGTNGTNGADGADGDDGATFIPHIKEVTGGYELSWSNNGGLPNPQTVTIYNGDADDGATFTPTVTQVAGGYQLSWTNDKGLPNPQSVTIMNGTDGSDGSDGTDGDNGATFTPIVTPITGGYELSWTNDAGLENPQTIYINNGTDGFTPTVSAVRVANGVMITVTNRTGSVTQLVNDGQPGQAGAKGTTFTPTVTPISGGYQLSWTNDGGAQNPDTISIYNGQPGQGVPAGGTTGQVLAKSSDSDYATSWIDPPQGGGGESRVRLYECPQIFFSCTGASVAINEINGTISNYTPFYWLLQKAGGFSHLYDVRVNASSSNGLITRARFYDENDNYYNVADGPGISTLTPEIYAAMVRQFKNGKLFYFDRYDEVENGNISFSKDGTAMVLDGYTYRYINGLINGSVNEYDKSIMLGTGTGLNGLLGNKLNGMVEPGQLSQLIPYLTIGFNSADNKFNNDIYFGFLYATNEPISNLSTSNFTCDIYDMRILYNALVTE